VHLGDLICIDWNKAQDRLTFVREGEGALVAKELPLVEAAAASAEAKDGKSVSPPAEVVAEERKSHAAQPGAAPAAASQGRKKQDR
jgi:hypothetical protein